MNARRIDELDGLAMEMAAGEIDRGVIWKMNFLESWFVSSLVNFYSMTLLGFMSREQCSEFKYKLAGIYRRFALEFAESGKERQRWHNLNKAASLKISEAYRALRKDEPDAEEYTLCMAQALDIFSGTNVYIKLTAGKLEDPDFKKKCTDAVIAHADEWQDKLQGAIRWEDYPVLLEQFFKEELDSGVAKVAAGLDVDYLRTFARRNIPVKSEYPARIAENIKNMYETEKTVR